ncbi:RING finger protein 113A [Fasciola hepatica]|uniref:RNA polymerase II subunit B1 CTD phosphatase RPAP2 homolog n=1 Tax=Fasciola hepatica TaxID=6192 RepID=A0A4E0RT50_FASHE|nr:RING finger protein 113A [Fasciola hepatica]
MSLRRKESTLKSEHESVVQDQVDTNVDKIAPVPPFQGSKEDKILTRKRQALFLRQTLLIAERFSQNPVTPSMLASALPWLEREQYDDIAVERNANGNCGYALCPNPLGTSIHQVYRISSQRRRVYDATARKPFCSDWCYRAFQHVRKQVSSEPGWCRFVSNPAESVALSLLPPHASGRPGKLVLDALSRLKLEDSVSPVSSDNEGDDSDSDSHSASHSSDVRSDPSDSENHDRSGFWDSDADLLPYSRLNPTRLMSKTRRTPVETIWGKQVKVPTRNLVIERHDETQRVSTIPVPEKPVSSVTDIESTEACDLLHDVAMRLKQWLSSKALTVLMSPNTKDSTDLQLGVPSIDAPDVENSKTAEPVNDGGVSNSEDPLVPGVLPLIDSVSVGTMRRRLLMEALGPCFRSFLHRMGVPSQGILYKLDRAVQYFRLTNKNVHLTRIQRAIAALALLRIMAAREPVLKLLMDESQLQAFLINVHNITVDRFIRIVVQPFVPPI